MPVRTARTAGLALLTALTTAGCRSRLGLEIRVERTSRDSAMHNHTHPLPYDGANDPDLLASLAKIDREIRKQFDIEPDDTAVGVYDLRSGKAAMLRADTPFYAASIPKIAILLAYFDTHSEATTSLDDATRRELGLMIKQSSNEMAAKYSAIVGLAEIARVVQLPRYALYDANREGGLWVGKHYSKDTERNPDPLCGHSHAATIRQLLRYYIMLEEEQLVSPAASKVMREIFESAAIEHDVAKFMKGLEGRDVQVIRKSGTWESWHGDTAVVNGAGRHYIIAALVHHEKGQEYCEQLAPRIDDLMQEP